MVVAETAMVVAAVVVVMFDVPVGMVMIRGCW